MSKSWQEIVRAKVSVTERVVVTRKIERPSLRGEGETFVPSFTDRTRAPLGVTMVLANQEPQHTTFWVKNLSVYNRALIYMLEDRYSGTEEVRNQYRNILLSGLPSVSHKPEDSGSAAYIMSEYDYMNCASMKVLGSAYVPFEYWDRQGINTATALFAHTFSRKHEAINCARNVREAACALMFNAIEHGVIPLFNDYGGSGSSMSHWFYGRGAKFHDSWLTNCGMAINLEKIDGTVFSYVSGSISAGTEWVLPPAEGDWKIFAYPTMAGTLQMIRMGVDPAIQICTFSQREEAERYLVRHSREHTTATLPDGSMTEYPTLGTFNPDITRGQKKLLCALTYFVEVLLRRFPPDHMLTIVYYGSAPGYNLISVLDRYPNVSILGVDPRPPPMGVIHPRLKWLTEYAVLTTYHPADAMIADIRLDFDEANWAQMIRLDNELMLTLSGKYQYSMIKFKPIDEIERVLEGEYAECILFPHARKFSRETYRIVMNPCGVGTLNSHEYDKFIRNSWNNMKDTYDGVAFATRMLRGDYTKFDRESVDPAICLYSIMNESNAPYAWIELLRRGNIGIMNLVTRDDLPPHSKVERIGDSDYIVTMAGRRYVDHALYKEEIYYKFHGMGFNDKYVILTCNEFIACSRYMFDGPIYPQVAWITNEREQQMLYIVRRDLIAHPLDQQTVFRDCAAYAKVPGDYIRRRTGASEDELYRLRREALVLYCQKKNLVVDVPIKYYTEGEPTGDIVMTLEAGALLVMSAFAGKSYHANERYIDGDSIVRYPRNSGSEINIEAFVEEKGDEIAEALERLVVSGKRVMITPHPLLLKRIAKLKPTLPMFFVPTTKEEKQRNIDRMYEKTLEVVDFGDAKFYVLYGSKRNNLLPSTYERVLFAKQNKTIVLVDQSTRETLSAFNDEIMYYRRNKTMGIHAAEFFASNDPRVIARKDGWVLVVHDAKLNNILLKTIKNASRIHGLEISEREMEVLMQGLTKPSLKMGLADIVKEKRESKPDRVTVAVSGHGVNTLIMHGDFIGWLEQVYYNWKQRALRLKNAPEEKMSPFDTSAFDTQHTGGLWHGPYDIDVSISAYEHYCRVYGWHKSNEYLELCSTSVWKAFDKLKEEFPKESNQILYMRSELR